MQAKDHIERIAAEAALDPANDALSTPSFA